MIKIEWMEDEIPVYDITVEDNENFYANGILVHNCAEIVLPTKPMTSPGDKLTTPRKVKIKKENFEKYMKMRQDHYALNEKQSNKDDNDE